VIAIIDYEAGNLTSVKRALDHLGAPCRISNDLEFIASAERVIFPGVGAAGAAMRSLKRLGLDRALKEALNQGKPVLGICLGTQIIFESSQEDAATCLGILPGQTVRFPLDHRDYVCPTCGSHKVAVATGDQFFLESIDVDLKDQVSNPSQSQESIP
jgi:glutamine amidotransferase